MLNNMAEGFWGLVLAVEPQAVAGGNVSLLLFVARFDHINNGLFSTSIKCTPTALFSTRAKYTTKMEIVKEMQSLIISVVVDHALQEAGDGGVGYLYQTIKLGFHIIVAFLDH